MEDMLNMEDQSRFLYTGGEVNINLLPAFSVYLLGVAGVALNMQSGSETEMRNEQIDDDVLSNVRPVCPEFDLHLQALPCWPPSWPALTWCPPGLQAPPLPRYLQTTTYQAGR